MKEIIYVKQKQAVLISKTNQFVYEVSVFCRYKNYFGIIDSKLYTTNQEIPNIINTFFRDAHTEIVCSLFSAPLNWLLVNDFTKYIKPEKKLLTKVKTTKNVKSKTTIGKSRSWSLNGETNSP